MYLRTQQVKSPGNSSQVFLSPGVIVTEYLICHCEATHARTRASPVEPLPDQPHRIEREHVLGGRIVASTNQSLRKRSTAVIEVNLR